MATATKKRSATKKSGTKQSSAKRGTSKKSSTKRTAAKKGATKKKASKKASTKKNKLGVKNSLVNNINAHKKRGDSKSKKKSTVSKKQYSRMQDEWGDDK